MLTQQQIADATVVTVRAIQHVERRALGKIKSAIESEAEQAGMTVVEWLFEGIGRHERVLPSELLEFMKSFQF
jgi:hypothetical protein